MKCKSIVCSLLLLASAVGPATAHHPGQGGIVGATSGPVAPATSNLPGSHQPAGLSQSSAALPSSLSARETGALSAEIALKVPGNDAARYPLAFRPTENLPFAGQWTAAESLPLLIYQNTEQAAGHTRLTLTLVAAEDVYFHLGLKFSTGYRHDDCLFLMPGFWYRRNLRSPAEAPSFHTSDSWTVREDRLSTPLTAIFDERNGRALSVIRLDEAASDALATHSAGEIILSGKTSIGYTGFENAHGIATLSFGFPYRETPKTYIRKLTLAPPVEAYQFLGKGQSLALSWEIREIPASDFSQCVQRVWEYSYDTRRPAPVQTPYTPAVMKEVLSRFFTSSFVDGHSTCYYAGVELRTADCAPTGVAEVGFVGRTLLNAFNALEYGETTGASCPAVSGQAASGQTTPGQTTSGPSAPASSSPSDPSARVQASAPAFTSAACRQTTTASAALPQASALAVKASDAKTPGAKTSGTKTPDAKAAAAMAPATKAPDAATLAALAADARRVIDSYLENGFSPAGFFHEVIHYHRDFTEPVHSIRRQSEGLYALLHYLRYEKNRGRRHPQAEARVKTLLDKLLSLQQPDGSFPRKFHDDFSLVDASGGSTPSATLPLAMAYRYFGDKRYLDAARRTVAYLENELISKADYFSSTLDANCEDKEASLYASTAAYYLALATKGDERRHLADLSRRAAYFALSWYYTWDVPFAPGQMLGDMGLKTRGWGNVSVENNHIDVFIFDFADVLHWLAKEYQEPRFSSFADVIGTSMRQLLPYEGHLCGVAKPGYYPEVVQHTAWDYGKNGKGYYNDIFAPGWTVASLWELFSPGRAEAFFAK